MEKTTVNQERYVRYAKIRDKKGFSDAKVCREACISPSTLSDWKRGAYTPGFDNIIRIAKVLDVSANEFEAE